MALCYKIALPKCLMQLMLPDRDPTLLLSRCQARATPGRYSFRVVGPLPALADFSVSPTTSKMSSCTGTPGQPRRRNDPAAATPHVRLRRRSARRAHRGADQRAGFMAVDLLQRLQINTLAFGFQIQRLAPHMPATPLAVASSETIASRSRRATSGISASAGLKTPAFAAHRRPVSRWLHRI